MFYELRRERLKWGSNLLSITNRQLLMMILLGNDKNMLLILKKPMIELLFWQ